MKRKLNERPDNIKSVCVAVPGLTKAPSPSLSLSLFSRSACCLVISAAVHVTTPECTGDTRKAVARGADVVAYWSIEPGHHAVYGSKEFSSVYGRYLYFFSSLENKLEFEVGPLLGCAACRP